MPFSLVLQKLSSFYPFFQWGSDDPICPYVRTPMRPTRRDKTVRSRVESGRVTLTASICPLHRSGIDRVHTAQYSRCVCVDSHVAAVFACIVSPKFIRIVQADKRLPSAHATDCSAPSPGNIRSIRSWSRATNRPVRQTNGDSELRAL